MQTDHFEDRWYWGDDFIAAWNYFYGSNTLIGKRIALDYPSGRGHIDKIARYDKELSVHITERGNIVGYFSTVRYVPIVPQQAFVATQLLRKHKGQKYVSRPTP